MSPDLKKACCLISFDMINPLFSNRDTDYYYYYYYYYSVAQQSDAGPRPPVLQVSSHVMFYGVRLSVPRPTPDLEGQVSVFMIHEDKVAQLHL
jgi:hypothetical protein